MARLRSLPAVLTVLCGAGCQEPAPLQLELRHSFRLDGGPIMAATFSPDGAALATAGDLGDLRVLELPAQRVRWQAQPSDHWIGTLAFSPDGRRLACLGRHLTVHDAADGKELVRIDDVGPYGFAWSRDGLRFAYAIGGALRLRDGERTAEVATFEYPLNAVSFADDGALFVGDNVGRLWRVPPQGGAPELRFDHRRTGGDMVRSVAVACAGGDVFDLPSQGALRRSDQEFSAPGASFTFAVTPDGGTFALGGEARIVRWWRERGAQSEDLAVSGSVAALALHPDGRTLFVSTYDGHQALYERGRDPVAVPPHPTRVQGLCLSPDGTVLAIQGQRWRLQPLDGRAARELPEALAIDAGRRGAELLVQLADRVVVLDAGRDVEVASVPSPRGFSRQNARGPGDTLLIDGELRDLATGKVTSLPSAVLLHTLCDVATAADGNWAVAGVAGIEGDLGGLLLWDAAAGHMRVVDDGPVYTVAFAPDGRRLVYGCGDGMSVGMGPPERYLRVRDTKSLELLREVDVPVTDWRFLDARRALACTRGELQVWDVERLAPVYTVPLEAPCHGFLLAADRRTLVLVQQQEVRVYRLRP